jgi:hypothetical protein
MRVELQAPNPALLNRSHLDWTTGLCRQQQRPSQIRDARGRYLTIVKLSESGAELPAALRALATSV